QLFSDDYSRLDAHSAGSNEFSFLAGRLSYKLGLRGPCLVTPTACSSSLVSVHLACRSLRWRESDLALAGGVNAMLTPYPFISLSKMGALARDGRTRTFDRAADGYGRGEGCGVVVLKRLSDALADDDPILALVRGSEVNHDGAKSALQVPNGLAQEALLRQTLAGAGVEAHQVDYLEAHGVGSALGDAIEMHAAGAVLGAGRDRPLVVGSVKTNLGHLEAAAGVAGLIKVVLALQHQEIPPHLHFREPNSHIVWDELPVTVPTSPLPWPRGERPRIAGISAFGLSGINAHLLVEEAPVREPTGSDCERDLHVLSVSAKSETALEVLAAGYRSVLEQDSEPALADVCFTAAVGRTHFRHRLALVSESREQLRRQLDGFLDGDERALRQVGEDASGRRFQVAFLFPGEGSEYPGMGRRLAATEPTFRRALEGYDELVRSHLDRPLLPMLHPESGEDPFPDEPRCARLALFFVELALAELWRSWGIEPSWLLGDGVGEVAAACVAGVFQPEDGLRLIAGYIDSVDTESTWAVPRIGLISSASGRPLAGKLACDPDYWRPQRRARLNLEASLATLAEQGCRRLLEPGPQSVQRRDSQSDLPPGAGAWLPSLVPGEDEQERMLRSLAELYVRGADVSWASLNATAGGRKVVLPTYPFQRRRHWVEPAARIVNGS
ncbi:MAG: type I polyketide synthase, partial [Thermoanaerobaculia bacterium]